MDTAVFYVQWGEMMLIQALNQLYFVFSMECMVKYCFFCILFFWLPWEPQLTKLLQ